MTYNIEIKPSKNNRYEDNEYKSNPITIAKFKEFMKKTECLIVNLNALLILDKKIFALVYRELCMFINNDLINFDDSLQKYEDIKELLGASLVFVHDKYGAVNQNKTQKLEEVYTQFELVVGSMRNLYKNTQNFNKLRGILMEALGVSLFGTINNLKNNFFVWDFNAFENEVKIIINGRETADIYFEKSQNCYISEIKCRPSNINESQIDYVEHIGSRIINEEGIEAHKLILHGGTMDDYNYSKIPFREKLSDFTVYCIENIDQLLRKIYI